MVLYICHIQEGLPMEIQKEKYSITELSEILSVTDHALRYYEKEFNLIIPKDGRGRRYYTPDLANIMYKIREKRNEGLEIKAIKKILHAENFIKETPLVVSEETQVALYTPEIQNITVQDIRFFLEDFKDQITTEINTDISAATDHLSHEITKSKLELGACVENGMRKLESKMERHFDQVDKAIGVWREKNKKNIFRRMLSRTLK